MLKIQLKDENGIDNSKQIYKDEQNIISEITLTNTMKTPKIQSFHLTETDNNIELKKIWDLIKTALTEKKIIEFYNNNDLIITVSSINIDDGNLTILYNDNQFHNEIDLDIII